MNAGARNPGAAALRPNAFSWRAATPESGGRRYCGRRQRAAPRVPDCAAERVMSRHDLPHPVNNALTRILPVASTPTEPRKRPFDPATPRQTHP